MVQEGNELSLKLSSDNLSTGSDPNAFKSTKGSRGIEKWE